MLSSTENSSVYVDEKRSGFSCAGDVVRRDIAIRITRYRLAFRARRPHGDAPPHVFGAFRHDCFYRRQTGWERRVSIRFPVYLRYPRIAADPRNETFRRRFWRTERDAPFSLWFLIGFIGISGFANTHAVGSAVRWIWNLRFYSMWSGSYRTNNSGFVEMPTPHHKNVIVCLVI